MGFFDLYIYTLTPQRDVHVRAPTLNDRGQIPLSSKFIFLEPQLNDHLSLLY